MRIDEEASRRFIQGFLAALREKIRGAGIPITRLPVWLEGARIRFGIIQDCLVFAIEDGTGTVDDYSSRGFVRADIVVLLDTADFVPQGAWLALRQGPGPVSVVSVGDDCKPQPFKGAGFTLLPKNAFTNAGYAGPSFMSTLFFNIHLVVKAGESTILSFRVLPFAALVSESDYNERSFAETLVERCFKYLLEVESSLGDFWERRHYRLCQFSETKKDGVVVLGTDTGEELKELVAVRDWLRQNGYQAEL